MNTMNKFDILENNVKKAVRKLADLNRQNTELKEELNAFKKISGDSDALIRKNKELSQERKQLAQRIEKVLKKLKVLQA